MKTNDAEREALVLAPELPQAVERILPEAKQAITPAQAKIDAIANLTMAAYQKAATLELTPEEAQSLQADFPDEAFQPGAAGKEHLIYIEHAYLRDRFNHVFGMGKWTIVPRNRWAEPFRTRNNEEGSRVYVEAMLVVRGCFVGEAVGAMEYYPKNAAQNYGDAVEGAKTAAFRRCAKEFGVGLQAWKKEFCEGWWARRHAQRSKKPQDAQKGPATQAPPPKPPTEAPKAQEKPVVATEDGRNRLIEQLSDCAELAREYFEKVGQLLPTESLHDLPLRFVPATQGQFRALKDKIAAFGNGEQAGPAFPSNGEAVPPAETDDAPWRRFEMPFGKDKGVLLGEMPMKKLYGWWANYEVETEYNGKPKKQETIDKDQEFRDALDAAGIHYKFTKE